MIELIRQIPGPDFLIFFMVVAAGCLLLAWLCAGADSSMQYPLPDETHFGPLSLAYLRGGSQMVILAAVFRLLEKKMVELVEGPEGPQIVPGHGVTESPGREIETLVLRSLGFKTKVRELMKYETLNRRVTAALAGVEAEMRAAHLLRTPEEKQWVLRRALPFLAAMFALGGTKLMLGLSRGKPVGFLVIELIIAAILSILVLGSQMRLTRLGRHFVRRLQSSFDWARYRTRHEGLPEGVDVGLLVVLYGMNPLAHCTGAPGRLAKGMLTHPVSSGAANGGCGGDVSSSSGCSVRGRGLWRRRLRRMRRVVMNLVECLRLAAGRAVAGGGRTPRVMQLQWHVTERCNLACAHCYQKSPPAPELDFDGLLGILDQFRELVRARGEGERAGRGQIILTGGEPFLRPDFMALLERIAAERGWTGFAVLTNGSLIDAAIARDLSRLGPAYVQVSLEGTETTHDGIRGAGSWQDAVEATRRLVEAGVPTLIGFTA